MAYTKTNWVNNTTPLNATNMNKIEEGIAAVDTAVEAVKNGYLSLSGGTMTGTLIGSSIVLSNDIQIDKNDGTGIEILSEGSILFFAKDHILDSTITGISDSKGTSSTLVASLKCLNDNYLPLSGGTITGPLTVMGNISIDDSGGSIWVPAVYAGPTSSYATFISSDRITFPDNRGEITSVSDSTGTSSTVIVSQKCLSDNYIAKTSAAVSAAINLLPAGTSAPVDADYYVCQSVGGGTTDTTYYRRPMSYLWSYINGKLGNSYLPISGGTLTGALTATKFTGDGSGLTSIPAGSLTGTIAEARLPDLSGKYLPISGGTLTGSLAAVGSISVSGNLNVSMSDGAGVVVSDGQNAVLLS